MTERVKAYIFDMDGTIVDNCAFHVKTWQVFSRKHGSQLREDDILNWMGAQGGFFIEKILGRPVSREESDRLCAEKERLYRQLYHPVMPDGLREWLDYAHARGIRLALATGGPVENVDFILDALGLRGDFEVIIHASMYTRSKPDPECFLAAAKALGVEPRECRVYEDAPNGIQAAVAAGMECVAVTFTHPRETLMRSHPHRIIDSYRELGIFPVRPPRTAADEAAVRFLDELRECVNEQMPEVPLAGVVKIIDYVEIPKAGERYALVTVEYGARKWRVCVNRGLVGKGDVALFVSPEAAFPYSESLRGLENIRMKERVMRYGFGVTERVLVPIVLRNIYRNNPGILIPVDWCRRIAKLKPGTAVEDRLGIQRLASLKLRAANQPRKRKVYVPPLGGGQSREPLSLVEKVKDRLKRHRVSLLGR